jgi:hypothetical protein
MAKLRLDLEALDVQSFDTAGRGVARGTVLGASGEPFSSRCTEPSYPVVLCATNAEEVCPVSPTTDPCA